MNVKVLFIGDPHFQLNNLSELDTFIDQVYNILLEKQPNIIVVAGDLLHTHERLHTDVMNKAYIFVKKLSLITKTYVLVGNHDYTSNNQFLTTNHWMNGMKEWKNVVIVDKVICEKFLDKTFTFVPYVYPGKFKLALDTLKEKCWEKSDCIFAHQEFEGCKMGAIISEIGDKWSNDLPPVVSGHIHSRQKLGNNVFYPGTPMQHAFGESENNILALLHFKNLEDNYTMEEINLSLPKKKIIYVNIDDVDSYEYSDTQDKLKLTITGNQHKFKAFKKTTKYKEILNKGIKVIFKSEKIETSEYTDLKTVNFKEILHTLVMKQKNVELYNCYEKIINNRRVNKGDIFFL